MPFPAQNEIMDALLALVYARGGSVRSCDTYKPLADFFKLSNSERTEMRGGLLPNGNERQELRWNNNVQYARLMLVNKNFLSNQQRGIWALTPAGKVEAARIANNFPF